MNETNETWDLTAAAPGELFDPDFVMGELFNDPEYVAYREFNTLEALEQQAESL